ncbi:shikimate kinase [soil metagenome]
MEEAKRSIVLIGFMGTGKSSIGRLLAAERGWARFDTDEMVATALGLPISEIFAQLGEARFREEESTVLQSLAPEPPSIIVTGGGAVLRPANVARMRALGTVVCLAADEATLLRRLARRSNRPLLQNRNLTEAVPALLREREPHYLEAADFTIETSSLTYEQVAQSIRDHLALAG